MGGKNRCNCSRMDGRSCFFVCLIFVAVAYVVCSLAVSIQFQKFEWFECGCSIALVGQKYRFLMDEDAGVRRKD